NLSDGKIAEANRQLDLASTLEREGGGIPVASAAVPKPGVEPASAGPGEGGAGAGTPAPQAGSLDEYAWAAGEGKRLTKDLPRRKSGGGIAKAEDYELPEADVAALDAAVKRALAAKPAGETAPTWLHHGRICLRMAKEMAAMRRLERAHAATERGD